MIAPKDEIIQKLKAISKQNTKSQHSKMQAIYTKTMDIPRGRKQSFGAGTFDTNKTATMKSNRTNESKMSPVTTAQSRVL